MDLVSHHTRSSDVLCKHYIDGDFLITCNKIMIESILIIPILWVTMSCLYLLLIRDIHGNKGIEKEPYYGRKTGKIYTASMSREDHIV